MFSKAPYHLVAIFRFLGYSLNVQRIWLRKLNASSYSQKKSSGLRYMEMGDMQHGSVCGLYCKISNLCSLYWQAIELVLWQIKKIQLDGRGYCNRSRIKKWYCSKAKRDYDKIGLKVGGNKGCMLAEGRFAAQFTEVQSWNTWEQKLTFRRFSEEGKSLSFSKKHWLYFKRIKG